MVAIAIKHQPRQVYGRVRQSCDCSLRFLGHLSKFIQQLLHIVIRWGPDSCHDYTFFTEQSAYWNRFINNILLLFSSIATKLSSRFSLLSNVKFNATALPSQSHSFAFGFHIWNMVLMRGSISSAFKESVYTWCISPWVQKTVCYVDRLSSLELSFTSGRYT